MLQKQLLAKIILSMLSSVLLGVAFILLPILLPVSKLIRIAFIVFGVLTVINYIPSLISGIRAFSTIEGKGEMIGALIGIAIGTVMIFYHGTVLTVLAAVFLIVLPILHIILARDRLAAFRGEILHIVLGIVLIAFLPALMGALDLIVKVILIIIGSVMILVALANGYNGWRVWKQYTTPNPRRATNIFVDSTGDGVIDTIMVDTHGTGKADTEIKYRHGKRPKTK